MGRQVGNLTPNAKKELSLEKMKMASGLLPQPSKLLPRSGAVTNAAAIEEDWIPGELRHALISTMSEAECAIWSRR
jgi:hypothetical protein